jgi:uncharacterized protein
MDGDNPLDASAVHPEAYPVVERMVRTAGLSARELIGKTAALRAIEPRAFVDAQFGEPTIRDILRELEKPGRDPRPEFRTAVFKDDVQEMKDLTPGMLLEGVVTNVANFGAFVDIGVHQDGLVHVSQLADRFVKDPREVVKAGQIVRVKVVDVDLKRRRIALTMKLQEPVTAGPRADTQPRASSTAAGGPKGPRREPPRSPAPSTSMAAAFSKLRG